MLELKGISELSLNIIQLDWAQAKEDSLPECLNGRVNELKPDIKKLKLGKDFGVGDPIRNVE